MSPLQQYIDKAAILVEALPYIQSFRGKTVVVKYGGSTMKGADDDTVLKDLVFMESVGINPVIVHGGGPQIGEMLRQLKIESEFIDGLRVTDKRTVEIVEMVLSGSINKAVVTAINGAGGVAIGLSGKDGRLIEARKLQRTTRDPDSNIEKVLDLGFVGEPVQVNPKLLHTFAQSDLIPVIAPIGVGEEGETYNINADTAAGKIAATLQAAKLVMLTDIAGVLDGNGELISKMTPERADILRREGVIKGGMIPKLETCLDAVAQGVGAAHILDGRLPHVLLLEAFTAAGVGTMIEA